MRNTGLIVYDADARAVAHVDCLTTESRVKETGCYVADDNARCVRALVKQIDFVLLKYPTIKEAFVELPHGGAKSSRAASLMGLAIGGVLGLLYARNVQVRNITPLEVKRLVRAKGEVDKAEVQQYAESKFGKFTEHLTQGRAEHIADAAGALLAGLRKYYHE